MKSEDSVAEDSQEHTWWIPGVVHVRIKEGIRPEDFFRALSNEDEIGKQSEDFAALRKIKDEHRLLRREASFSFTPPGLPKEDSPPPGRDRYFTLYFSKDADVKKIVEKLRRVDQVEAASPAPRIIPPSALEEPLVVGPVGGFNSQWYIQRCKADQAWSLEGNGELFSGQGVVIADIDWGFLTSHREFIGRIERRYNSIDGTTSVSAGAFFGHGTAVLGILGAAADGSMMAGFAYGGNLWAIQAADGDPSVKDFQHWWFAIDYVRREDSTGRRKVICLEGETANHLNIETDMLVRKTVQDAIAAGVVVCVPAGNGGKDAGLDADGNAFCDSGSIFVGATLFDPDPIVNRKAGISNSGNRVTIWAPGDTSNDVTCGANADNDYMNQFGQTSGAAPKVAGTVALMLEANPALAPAEIRDILRTTGAPLADAATDPASKFLNAHGAVKEAKLRAVASPPATLANVV